MESRWSKALESVRKDVECFFGILKRRFRTLKLGIIFQDEDDINNMFFTCCILHTHSTGLTNSSLLCSGGGTRRVFTPPGTTRLRWTKLQQDPPAATGAFRVEERAHKALSLPKTPERHSVAQTQNARPPARVSQRGVCSIARQTAFVSSCSWISFFFDGVVGEVVSWYASVPKPKPCRCMSSCHRPLAVSYTCRICRRL